MWTINQVQVNVFRSLCVSVDQDHGRVCRGSGEQDLNLQPVVLVGLGLRRLENVCVADKQFYLLYCTIE